MKALLSRGRRRRRQGRAARADGADVGGGRRACRRSSRRCSTAGADFRTASAVRASRRCSSPCAKDALDVVRVLLKAGADVNETVPIDGRRRRLRRTAAAGRAPAPLLLAVENGHFELAVALLEAGADPNDDAAGLHGAAHDHLGPQAGRRRQRPGARRVRQAEQPRARQEARRARRERERADDEAGRTGTTRASNELGATPFLLAALTADAELMRMLVELGADPLAAERRELHAADGRGRRRHALARRGRRHREPKCSRPCSSLLELGADIERGRQQRRDRHARRRLQEPPEGRAVPRRQGREDRRLEPARTSTAGRRWRSPRATGSATSSRRPRPMPPSAR